MISKTRKNRKNKISKKRKIYGGGEIFSWNLGPIILKKEKGLLSDTYWIEYPIDPIQNGWTQIAPTLTDPVPKYTCSETVKPPKEEYTWVKDKIKDIHRPLPDGSFELGRCYMDDKICGFDDINHNKKLSQQTWKNSEVIPNTRIEGKKEFIRNLNLGDNYKSKKKLYNILKRLLVNCIEKKNMNVADDMLCEGSERSVNVEEIPSEFIDLYKDVENNYWKYDYMEGKLLKLKKEKQEREKKLATDKASAKAKAV
jgi:hypothetical protein